MVTNEQNMYRAKLDARSGRQKADCNAAAKVTVHLLAWQELLRTCHLWC